MTSRFFVSTPIGAEAVCIESMKFYWPHLLAKDARPQISPFPPVEIFEGGFEFEADLFIGLQLNFFLKTANRILLRLDSFRVRDLPKFYNRMLKIPWREYVATANVDFEIAAQKSRLNNEKRLHESAEAALLEIFSTDKKTMPPESSQQKVYIRLYDDQCTISLDTSGEHLHKRGWASLKGEAPLRETLANYLLSEFTGDLKPDNLSLISLVDPMVGSATFLTEARSFFEGNYSRKYSFQNWIKCPKLFLAPNFAANYKHEVPKLFQKYAGVDSSAKMIEVAKQNWNSLEEVLKKTTSKSYSPEQAGLYVADSLANGVAEIPSLESSLAGAVWLIVNPPYGERLADHDLKPKEMLTKLCINYRPERLGVLLPEKIQLKDAVPKGYKLLTQVKLNNGGLRCLFTVLTRL